jgi:hypothetical protein
MKKYAIKLGAVFGFITVITTLGVHLIPIPASTFDEAVILYQNPIYLFSRWLIIFHCIAVIISMSGVYIVINSTHNLHAKLGLMSFSVFSWAEITRMLLSLTYLANLRRNYVEQTDPMLRTILRSDIENFRYVGEGLFALFVLGFALGNLFYGIELSKTKGLSRIVGVLLLIWFLTSIVGLFNLFRPSDAVSGFFEIYSITFQPLTRGLTAYWLWKQIHYKNVEKI